MDIGVAGALLVGGLWAATVCAQEAPSAATCNVPEGTELQIATGSAILSKTAKPGDKFPVRLNQSLTIDGKVVLMAGVVGTGEVVHAARSSGWGKAGELILAARYLEVGGNKLPLRAFRINSVGLQTHGIIVTGAAVARTIYADDIEVPAGTVAVAKVAQTTAIPCPSQG